MQKYISALSSSCFLGLLVGAFGCSGSPEFTVPNETSTSAEASTETDSSVGNDSASSTSSSRSTTSTTSTTSSTSSTGTLTTDSGTQDSQNDSVSDSGAVDSVVSCQTYSITDILLFSSKTPSNLAFGISNASNLPLTVTSGSDNTKTQKIFEDWAGCQTRINYNMDPLVVGLTYSDFSYIPVSKIKSITAHLSMRNSKLSIVNKQIVITPMYKPPPLGSISCEIDPSSGTTQVMTSNEIVINPGVHNGYPFTGVYISFLSEDETGNNSFQLDQIDIDLCD
jgi:hypothetical protein